MIKRRTIIATTVTAGIFGLASAAYGRDPRSLTQLEKRMLRRAGMFAFCGEWPWDEGNEEQNELDQAALRSAILKLRE